MVHAAAGQGNFFTQYESCKSGKVGSASHIGPVPNLQGKVMPQQANQPGDVPIPGQQEGKMGQWNRNEGTPSNQQDVQQDEANSKLPSKQPTPPQSK